MANESAPLDRPHRIFLLWLTAGITLLFLLMIRQFLLAVLLAAIFAALVHPLHAMLRRRVRGRKALASAATVITVILLVVLPSLVFFGVVANEAVYVGRAAGPWITQHVSEGGPLDERVRNLPIVRHLPALQRLVPSSEALAARLGDAMSGAASFLFHSAAQLGKGTLSFFLQLFVMFYAMFYFLVDGREILDRILYFVPLAKADQNRLLEKFVSVARATLKGSVLIAMIQGALAGLSFWAAGVPAAALWGTVTAVVSIIPAVGAALVWVPMVGYLLLTNQPAAAIGVFLWGALVVSTVDNFLRPWLVGRDARMSDLLVLLSTLGGLILFGIVGFIVGPIVAALFVTVWHLYGEAFASWLPDKAPSQPEA